MNRLVLIGNGYDLAAGLKTSYEDFLVDYFKEMINHALKLNQLQLHYDELIEVKHSYPTNQMQIFKDESTLKEVLSNKSILLTPTNKEYSTTEHRDYNQVYVKIKSSLLENLLGNYNWRDIESFYFQKLLEIFGKIESYSNANMENREDSIIKEENNLKQLNEEFEAIKIKLAEYISKISKPINNLTNSEPLSCFKRIVEPLNEEDIFNRFFNNDKTKVELEKVFIVNFNYTPNFNTHFFKGLFNEDNIEVVNIHGYFKKPKEIIFGYGDDSHPSYEKLEASGNDEYLKHIKSFHYPHSKSYINLMNFIEFDQFEVQIIGHSLGLSDRVLLKSIFEHENCKMIKIYHRGNKKDMIHKYMALSRHCSDKAAMRRKILEYDEKDVVNKENE